MTTSLYDLSVGSFIQSLSGVRRVLKLGAQYAEDNNLDANDFVKLRLHDSMLPLLFQIKSVRMHSVEAIQGIEAGVFTPPKKMDPMDYAGLQGVVDQSIADLKALSVDHVNGLAGKEVLFKMDDIALPFTAENFILSFSLPNLNFHAATAYDLLRAEGVPLTKSDFLGKLRLNRPE